jgi:hypothetical protein
MEEALILRNDRQRNATEQIEQGGSSPLGGPDGTEMFPCRRNLNQPRKRQPISKAHQNGDGQSKVA